MAFALLGVASSRAVLASVQSFFKATFGIISLFGKTIYDAMAGFSVLARVFRRGLVGDAGLAELSGATAICICRWSPHALDITLPPNSRARLSAVRMHLSNSSVGTASLSLRSVGICLCFDRFCSVACCWLRLGCTQYATQAQSPPLPQPSDSPYIVEGVSDTIVYSVGHSLQINGTVKNGAIALGGDLIVRGVVEGDVAAIGGSVIQLEGARIGGDVMVVGGAYHHVDQYPNRNPQAMTIMYAGYEQELRNIMRNPERSAGAEVVGGVYRFSFAGCALLVHSLAGFNGRHAGNNQSRHRATSTDKFASGAHRIHWRVGDRCGRAVCAALSSRRPISALLGLMALLLILIAALFGRVMIYAATGRWLQRKFLKVGRNSEAVALLPGTVFWITLIFTALHLAVRCCADFGNQPGPGTHGALQGRLAAIARSLVNILPKES